MLQAAARPCLFKLEMIPSTDARHSVWETKPSFLAFPDALYLVELLAEATYDVLGVPPPLGVEDVRLFLVVSLSRGDLVSSQLSRKK